MTKFETNYVEAIKQVENLIQMMFEVMSRCSRYWELTPEKRNRPGRGHNTCLYYGRKGSQRCDREICPVLGEEK